MIASVAAISAMQPDQCFAMVIMVTPNGVVLLLQGHGFLEMMLGKGLAQGSAALEDVFYQSV
jgi:hypothetical protein